MTKGNPLTNNLSRQELEKMKEETEAKIIRLESELKDLKSMLTDIKGQIFRHINSEFPVTHSQPPLKPINERK